MKPGGSPLSFGRRSVGYRQHPSIVLTNEISLLLVSGTQGGPPKRESRLSLFTGLFAPNLALRKSLAAPSRTGYSSIVTGFYRL
jgi:hypothetical protein